MESSFRDWLDREDCVLFEKKIPTEAGKDIPGFVAKAHKLLAEPDAAGFAGQITLISISSVVPACTQAAVRLAQTICRVPPVVVSWQCDTGLSFAGLSFPDRIGADRIADAAWAAVAYTLPAMTADLGTATTINVIGRPAGRQDLPGQESEQKDREGTGAEAAAGIEIKKMPFAHQKIRGIFLGGMIAAGVRTSLQALRSGTAQLPALELRPVSPENLIGRDTDTCMLSAAVVGTAAMIDGLADRVEQQLGCPLTLILTGGNAQYVRGWLRHPCICEPCLAAKGTAMIGLMSRHREMKETYRSRE